MRQTRTAPDAQRANICVNCCPAALVQGPWGEVSAGVNFFNPSANTSVFAKVDVTFGEDIDGLGGKAGMRVAR